MTLSSGHEPPPALLVQQMSVLRKRSSTEGYAPFTRKTRPRIRELGEQLGIAPHYFYAKKGDVLICTPILLMRIGRKNLALSRRAVVCHFFAKNAS